MKKTFEINGMAKVAQKELIGRDLLVMREQALRMIERLQMPTEIDDNYPFLSKGESAIVRHLQTINQELKEAFINFGVWMYGIECKLAREDVSEEGETPETDKK